MYLTIVEVETDGNPNHAGENMQKINWQKYISHYLV